VVRLTRYEKNQYKEGIKTMTKTFNCKVNYGLRFNGEKACKGLVTLSKNNGKIAIESVYFNGTTKEGKNYTAQHDVNPLDDYTREIYDYKRDKNHPNSFVWNYRIVKEYNEEGTPTAYQFMTIWVDTTKPVEMKDESEIQF
jgi:hypothetical protein